MDAQLSSGINISTTDDQLPPCCLDTMLVLVKNNLMMTCSECHRIIKCFEEKVDFDNYLKLCTSLNRKHQVGKTQQHYVVAFDKPI